MSYGETEPTPVYRDILASNNKGKLLPNSSIRIDNKLILDNKTCMVNVYKPQP